MIRFDPLKRLRTLEQRGLDFLDAERVFAGRTLEFEDLRRDYSEVRTVCLGLLEGHVVVIVYTQRSFFRQIISMRKANAREQLRFGHHFS
ncbi:BrnT family toxin [Cyanobium gracile]|uniref:BrnT family toxin n=1 Tax=Cyanobium gracile UHCC 0281 TaxID=3110309 RepID=A0ABU5SVQ9_9CYAN|nr:BrnT family toxin [Cyanobium gracile]MEA5442137.1 BrnT family toxin [Cyanobium gracile UHCC 0281]